MCARMCLYIKIHIYVYTLPPNMISCNLDLVSRLRTGYMVNTATDYALETSTAQTNLSTSVHDVIKSMEEEQGFFVLNSVM